DDGNIISKDLETWNLDNPDNKVEWESLHTDVADIDAGGNISVISKGSAVMIGTVTDKWGVTQTISYLVIVGTSSNAVEDGDGKFWYPTDKEHIWIECDEDGNVITPPNYVFDLDEDGPADPTNPSIPVKPGEDGKYYEEDPDYPNIWHEIDPETGSRTGKSSWGGPSRKPGGGDDKAAVYDPDSQAWWWADLEQNVFQKVSPVDGQLYGDLTGGGGSMKPWETPAKPIIKINGKYYVKADGGDFYYGDKLEGGNGKLMSTEDALHETDEIFYYDMVTGTMVTQKAMKDQLEDLLNQAKSLNEDDYTADSWSRADLPGAVSGGEFVLEDDTATLEEVKDAINDLIIAMARLEEKNYAEWVIGPDKKIMDLKNNRTLQLTATTKIEGIPVAVTWSMVSDSYDYANDDDEVGTLRNFKATTTIDPNTGLIQIAANETVDRIIVTAEDAEGNKVTALVYVVPDKDLVDILDGLTGTTDDLGKIFMADGILWRVLKVEENGDTLITTTSVESRTPFNSSASQKFYPSSRLDTECRSFYARRLNDLQKVARPAVFPAGIQISSTANARNTQDMSAWSYVDEGVGEKTCFALSATELYFSPGFIGANPAPNSTANDPNRTVTGGNGRFWTRTARNTNYVIRTTTPGAPASTTPTSNRWIRPAMWINVN
ncbi:MAG: hypothetical protein LBB91_09215, partial [Clostridiales bacterium]|nr:hypothetical protein [Clostridiales bacterium]